MGRRAGRGLRPPPCALARARAAAPAGVCDKKALAELPAEEREEWDKLWADVAGLLRRLDAGKPAAPAGK